jgi:SulP family sulfate permease
MAGILFLVAWGLIDFHHIKHIWHTSKIESAILAATLIGTLFNLELGIFLGVFLSLILYLYRTSKPEIVPLVPAPEEGAYHFIRAKGRPECPQLRIVRINGSIYFGAASYVQAALQQIDEDNPQQKSVLVSAASLTYLDIAGAEVLAQEARRRRRLGGGLYFYRLKSSIVELLRQGGYTRDIGEGAFFPVMTDVTRALYWTLNPDICRNCKTRIFKECNRGILPDGFRRERLLFATDGTEFSQAPADVAVALAKGFGVTLDIMTAVESPAEDEIAKVRIGQIERKALLAGVDSEQIIRYGKQPVAEVVAAAAAADSHILVIGRRPPRGDIKERLVGDIALQIIVGSPCHVLIANWPSLPCQKRILMATDGSRISETMAEVTAEIAKALHLPVTVLAAVPPGGNRAKAEEDIAEKLGLLKVEGIECTSMIVEKAPEPAILEAAIETGADLVVIGNDQRKGLSRKLVGQTTDRIVGGLKCAVLVVKRPPEPDALVAAVRNQA